MFHFLVMIATNVQILRPRQSVAISQTIFSDAFFVNEKFRILIKISLKFVPRGIIDNKPAFIYITAWHRIGRQATI